MSESKNAIIPAVSADRWWQLVLGDGEDAQGAGYAGLFRHAVATDDFAALDGLLDRDDARGLTAAAYGAEVLGATGARDRLRARARTSPLPVAVTILRALEALGDEEAWDWYARDFVPPDQRLAFALDRAGSVAVAAAGEGSDGLTLVKTVVEAHADDQELFDRTQGELQGWRLVSGLGGDDVLPPAVVEAARRRDARGLAGLLHELVAGDASGARRSVVLAVSTVLEDEQPRGEAFDLVANPALLHAAALRALRGPPDRAAAVLAYLEGRPPHRTCRTPSPAGAGLAMQLLDAGTERALKAFVALATTWRLTPLAPALVRVATDRSFGWVYRHAELASRLEAPIVNQLGHRESLGYGLLALASQCVGDGALTILRRQVTQGEFVARALLETLVRSFPTPEFVAQARRAPPLGLDELAQRFAFLAALDGGPALDDPEATALHCHGCGHAWNAAGTKLVQAGFVTVPHPAPACPACGAVGLSVAVTPENTPAELSHASLKPDENPRSALARATADPDAAPLDRAELALLAGDDAAAHGAMQLVDPMQLEADFARGTRLLLQLGRAKEARDLALRGLRGEGDATVLTDEEDRQVRTILAEACAQLSEPVPDVPRLTDRRLLPSVPYERLTKVGRNDPCPCGSGVKFKKCHGAR